MLSARRNTVVIADEAHRGQYDLIDGFARQMRDAPPHEERLRAASAWGEALGLSDEELAFYDAPETNNSPVEVLGESTLTAIAPEVAKAVRADPPPPVSVARPLPRQVHRYDDVNVAASSGSAAAARASRRSR